MKSSGPASSARAGQPVLTDKSPASRLAPPRGGCQPRPSLRHRARPSAGRADAVEVVLLDAHRLGDLGDGDARARAHQLERLLGARAAARGRPRRPVPERQSPRGAWRGGARARRRGTAAVRRRRRSAAAAASRRWYSSTSGAAPSGARRSHGLLVQEIGHADVTSDGGTPIASRAFTVINGLSTKRRIQCRRLRLAQRLESRSERSRLAPRQPADQRAAGDAPERPERAPELVAVVEMRAAAVGREAVLGLGVRARRPAPVPLGVGRLVARRRAPSAP